MSHTLNTIMQDINVNKVVLIGRIEEEPVLRHTQNNTAICSFRVAVTETYVNREGNRMESKSTHSVTVWGQKAEMFKNQAHANSRVFVEGSLRNRSYEDRDGNRKWVTEINAQNAFVLDAVSGYQTPQGVQGGYTQPQESQPAPPQQRTAVPGMPVGSSEPAAQQPASPPQQPPVQQGPPTVESSSSSHVPEDDLPF
ncbi:MAG: single-stranded DNA-binding protein [Rhodothermaceae bacterium]|nr:single-stranded DNA-binding protein [Rhodothermaceae bacterium]MXW32912.1 single-stranded DNA-binding protein [Rhodothermaceae bacterium]MYC03968.1 single-stranded DNA-binding protein [Rhodothermaceae bacterium]MYE62526.1 single-stranded DNA-binding protein [Rhodothermaceae bacterium]MYI18187.1 single-stranded DNA-binding protein [Rhodothermaceae bacterium]